MNFKIAAGAIGINLENIQKFVKVPEKHQNRTNLNQYSLYNFSS